MPGEIAPEEATNGRTRSYPASLLPGLIGLGMGVAITQIGLSDPAIQALAGFQLWRGVVIVQTTVFIGVAAYLVDASGDPWLPRLSRSGTSLVALMTVSAIGLPHVLPLSVELPLPGHVYRIWFVVTSGLVAMVLLTNRLARIHAGLAAAQDPDAHRQLRQATQDLLIIAAGTITLGTLGTGVLQTFLEATAPENSFTREHVLAYGSYFAVLLLLFFAPVFAAERASGVRIRDRLEADRSSPVAGNVLPPDLNLEASLVQRLGAAFGVLAPLLGAIVSQLLPRGG